MFSYDPNAGSDNAAHNIQYNGVPLEQMTIEELRQMGVEMFNKMVGEMPADLDALQFARAAISTEPTEKATTSAGVVGWWRLVDGVPVWKPGNVPAR